MGFKKAALTFACVYTVVHLLILELYQCHKNVVYINKVSQGGCPNMVIALQVVWSVNYSLRTATDTNQLRTNWI